VITHVLTERAARGRSSRAPLPPCEGSWTPGCGVAKRAGGRLRDKADPRPARPASAFRNSGPNAASLRTPHHEPRHWRARLRRADGPDEPGQDNPCDSCASLWLFSRGLLTSASLLPAPCSLLRAPGSLSPVTARTRSLQAATTIPTVAPRSAGVQNGGDAAPPSRRAATPKPHAVAQRRQRYGPQRGSLRRRRGAVAGRRSPGALGPSRGLGSVTPRGRATSAP
jgi:hypothetical protein